ncbi:MAG: Mg/Co/Ni transporter MgtE / CBS domain [Candidatus Saccharicenans subterraneus]|uniref:Magnesium transporter MgtE n=1 Tax=Candidatus Saccharicenans subterraneus TaxID=2508984 RepID=A0A3E2BQY3_9BACT|nr:MAG: Mg/Co/Ni transporter MgtE / CBS domain [Candidatus Saccharicenans subterraneum]
MVNPLLAPELRELLAEKNYKELCEFCESIHPAQIAEFISALNSREIWEILSHLSPSLRGEIFSHLDEEVQLEMIETLGRDIMGKLLSEMPPDDRVDLMKKLPKKKREAIIPAMAQAEREDLRRLIAYPEGTAGSVMTSEYVTLTPELTVDQALRKLRLEAPDKETIYYSYVIDENHKLVGFVSLKDLVVAPPGARVKDIMYEDVIYAKAHDDQEEVARMIQKYDLLAIPVVDDQDRLVGIITHDDVMDVIQQEQQEDIEKLMAIGGSHEVGVYTKLSTLDHLKSRTPWILVLALMGFVSGLIIQNYESVFLQVAILASFMPMLTGTGGNAGSQSATLVIRALAVKEITVRDALFVLVKEFRVAFLMSLILAVVAYFRVHVFYGDASLPAHITPVKVGLAVAIALALQVITSTLIGAMLPLVAVSVKIDPAVVASPLLATMVDIFGLLIYFNVAQLVLRL